MAYNAHLPHEILVYPPKIYLPTLIIVRTIDLKWCNENSISWRLARIELSLELITSNFVIVELLTYQFSINVHKCIIFGKVVPNGYVEKTINGHPRGQMTA